MAYTANNTPHKFIRNEICFSKCNQPIGKISYFGNGILGKISLVFYKIFGKVFTSLRPVEITVRINSKKEVQSQVFAITRADLSDAIKMIAKSENFSLNRDSINKIITSIKKKRNSDQDFISIIQENLKSPEIATKLWKWNGTYKKIDCLKSGEKESSCKRLKLTFVGDIMGHECQINSAKQKDSTYNYEPAFRYIKPIIQSADLAIGNLEVTFSGPPYKGYPRFSSPDVLAKTLKDIGFDLVSTSNNHCNDWGPQGLVRTLEVLDKNGIQHTGTFRNQEERDLTYPLIVQKNGFKLAFLNYTYGTNGHKTNPPTMINLIDGGTIEKDMEKAHQLHADAIIVMVHWGEEYETKENKKQRELAKKLFDMGALLVIGTHPHVLQPIKEQEVKSEKRVVVYSLGNFISGQNASQIKEKTDCSIIYEVELEKHGDADTAHIGKQHYIPVYRHIRNGTRMTIPISPFENSKNIPFKMSKKSMNTLKKKGTWIRKLISQSNASEQKLVCS